MGDVFMGEGNVTFIGSGQFQKKVCHFFFCTIGCVADDLVREQITCW